MLIFANVCLLCCCMLLSMCELVSVVVHDIILGFCSRNPHLVWWWAQAFRVEISLPSQHCIRFWPHSDLISFSVQKGKRPAAIICQTELLNANFECVWEREQPVKYWVLYTEKQKDKAFALYMYSLKRWLLELTFNLSRGCKFNQRLLEVIDALWRLLQGLQTERFTKTTELLSATEKCSQ